MVAFYNMIQFDYLKSFIAKVIVCHFFASKAKIIEIYKMKEKVVILIFYVPILLYKKQHCKDKLILFSRKRNLTLIICSKIHFSFTTILVSKF